MDLVTLMKESGYNYELLKSKINCSLGVLSSFIGKSEIVQFDIALKVIKMIAPEKEKEFMFDYCLKLDMPKHLKCALEYAVSNNNDKLLKNLIDKVNSSSNREMKEFGCLYGLLYDRLIGKKTTVDVYNNILGLKFISKDLSVLIDILEMQLYYHIHDFKKIQVLIPSVGKEIKGIKDRYLESSYRTRYNQMVAFTYLHVENNPKKAREVAEESVLLDMGKTSNGFFYNIIATSYFDSSIDKMNYYARKTTEMYSVNKQVVTSLKNRFNKLNMIMTENYHDEFVRDNRDPLDYYIEGVANNNVFKVLQSLVELNKEGSTFFANKVVNTLRDMGCDESLIESIQTIH